MCRRQVAELAKHIDDFSRFDTNLIIVGNGNPGQIQKFGKITGFQGMILTDPELHSYKALKFRKGMGTMVGIKSVAATIKSVGSGYISASIQGDALQQGGAVIVGPTGQVHYFHQNTEAGDKPSIREMLDACREKAA